MNKLLLALLTGISLLASNMALADDGKPIAASRGSVGFLAEAGVLNGRRFAFALPVNVEERPSFRGSTYTGTGTERDGIVNTSGICPLASRSLDLSTSQSS